ncbi:MAG: YbbR-like domain-containing protein [Dysgonomonas sp.]|nr:YbbR-like domain-containing protein [Dysgonomonas sp.]
MSDTKDIILREVRSFFKRVSWRKILTFLFFILLAAIFWLIQIYDQKFDTMLTIPVKYVNVPDSIVFDHELPDNIYAYIKDDGATVFRYYFTKRDDSIVVDVREMVKGTREKVIQGRNFEQLLRNKLFVTSELISYSPTRVSYSYEVLHQKKLPVIYDGYIQLAPGYLLDEDLLISPDSVIAYGSKAALDTLSFAHTASDTISNVTSDRDIAVPMRNIRGVKFVPNTIELSILVDEFTLKEVEVPVRCINLPDNLDIKFFPSSVKVPFFVGLKRFKDIDADSFQIIVNYNDIKDLKEASIPVRITESPDYIRTKPLVPAEVEFILEQK